MLRAKPLLLGCIVVPAGLFVLLLLMGLLLFLAGPVDLVPIEVDREVPIEAQTSDTATAAAGALRVELRFEEGEFVVCPGEAAGGIHVQAEYDQALYALDAGVEQERGVSVHRVDFHPRKGFASMRRLVHRQETSDTRVRVHLPTEISTELFVHMRKGQIDIDVTRLSLTALVVDCAMGEFQLDIGEPNPVPMERLELRTHMGHLAASGLGNSHASAMLFDAKMGNFEVDLDGAWDRDTVARIKVAMGEAALRLPRYVDLETGNNVVFLGSLTVRNQGRSTLRDPEDARHVFRAAVSVSFGEVSIR